uniref:Uncharacterized protein n=1 Tax=Glossina brevipalpis TaxID=37001 RepID=A0A1A9W8W2_9MUSC
MSVFWDMFSEYFLNLLSCKLTVIVSVCPYIILKHENITFTSTKLYGALKTKTTITYQYPSIKEELCNSSRKHKEKRKKIVRWLASIATEKKTLPSVFADRLLGMFKMPFKVQFCIKVKGVMRDAILQQTYYSLLSMLHFNSVDYVLIFKAFKV